jgi:hypothetical protein
MIGELVGLAAYYIVENQGSPITGRKVVPTLQTYHRFGD